MRGRGGWGRGPWGRRPIFRPRPVFRGPLFWRGRHHHGGWGCLGCFGCLLPVVAIGLMLLGGLIALIF